MKPVFPRLFAVFVLLILACLAVWTAADWNQRREAALDRGQAALRALAGQLTEKSIRHQAWTRDDVSALVARTQVPGVPWRVLLLQGPEGVEYYWGPKPPRPLTEAVPRWSPRPESEVLWSLPVFLAAGQPLRLEAIGQFYGRGEIFQVLRTWTFVLLLLLLGSALVMVVTLLDDGPVRKPSAAPQDPETDRHDEPAAPGPGPSPWEPEAPVHWPEDLVLDDLPPLKTESLSTRVADALAAVRGPSDDLSLVLFSAKAEGLPWGDWVKEAFEAGAETVVEGNRVGVVLSGWTLDRTLAAARVLVDTADRLNPEAGVKAGASARNTRTLAAELLTAEAQAALKRAEKGAGRVLGLRADPVKFAAQGL